jgi:salicylate hydroxylase
VVGLVEKCAKWTIAELPSLNTWSSSTGRAVLLGDAAHAMSPHAAQGGAMAIEDAAVLDECLRFFDTNLSVAVKAYEAIRRPRVERVQEIARGNGDMFVLPDGQEQEQRDVHFLALMDTYDFELEKIGREGLKAKAKPKADMNATWPSPAALMWLHGYDAVEEVSWFEF